MPVWVEGDRQMSKISINMDSLKAKKEWKRHKIKEGHNVFRILPPFGEGSNGYPYRKWMIIWSLVDPSSNRARPFASSLTSEKRCPITEYVEALQKKAEVIKSKMQTQGSSEVDIKEALKPINKVISNIRPKTVYVYNAIDKAGTVGLLEVKSTAHKKLKSLMLEYISEYNQDPTSLNSDQEDSGVWFDFIRVGEGFDTEYDVKKSQTKAKVNGQLVFVDDRSALPENVSQSYENLAYDLTSIYQIKTYDELREILMINLKKLTQEIPEALVAGFDDFSDVEDIKASNDNTGETAPKTFAAPKGKVTVNLNLNDDDETEEVEEISAAPIAKRAAPAATKRAAPAATKRAAPAATKRAASVAVADNDDIFALADSILNQ